ncbi:MAG TPA: hypothetical protein DCW68_02000 [Rhodospirillaceae bacterium]|nr:MAG: hypothetical protein A2018_04965 [Alphaproteobacteria bacterium GWF2_58_20]HAU28868.1 hypothetical protein [Rhodospirillaceae bacterium]
MGHKGCVPFSPLLLFYKKRNLPSASGCSQGLWARMWKSASQPEDRETRVFLFHGATRNV